MTLEDKCNRMTDIMLTFTHMAVVGGRPMLNRKYNITKSEKYTIAVTI